MIKKLLISHMANLAKLSRLEDQDPRYSLSEVALDNWSISSAGSELIHLALFSVEEADARPQSVFLPRLDLVI